MSNTNKTPSPALFFNTVNSYQKTAAIKAAIELDVFTAISEGQTTPKLIAQKCSASERGMRILCDYLTIQGFLNKEVQCYSLTPDSQVFLVKNSPAYVGNAIEFLLSPTINAGFGELTAAVQKGGTVIPEEGTIAPDNPVWVQFARSMAPMMGMSAQLIAKLADKDANRKLKILDIAASHGLFGIEFAKNNPHAEIVAVDWANVLEVAKENAQIAGVSDRYSTIAGSAFDVDFGDGYDLVLITNFLHHFDISTCENFLKKVYTSLTDNGRAVTLEVIPDEDRISPPDAAAFSLVMLASTPQGDAYTFEEYKSMFSNAGFMHSEIYPLTPSPGQVIISSK